MKNNRFTSLIYVLFLILTSCSDNYYNFSGFIWGTTYNITYKANRNLDDSVTAAMRQIDSSLSMFNPASTVAHINAGTDMHADSMVAEVLNLSRRIYRVSHGAFDPTIAPLVELWGFGTDKTGIIPDSADVQAALARVGFDKCHISDDGIISMNADSMRLDFSAIAKGYGVDHVARVLKRNGCSDFMVEIGGEIAASGLNRHGQPWHIQIDAPVADSCGRILHDRLTVVELTDAAIATSGNYRNYRDMADGSRIGHTISTTTGYPVKTGTLSVSVIAPDCATADALATAAMAMPYPEARAMIDSLPDAEALFVIASPDGMEVLATAGFPRTAN